MKTVGLIGGLSWQSTIEYYRTINELVKSKLGGNNAAKIILHSVNFAEIEKLQAEGQWNELEQIISKIGMKLESYGADAILICANTMHKVSGLLESQLKIPLLHIVDATAEEIKSKKLEKVGLLGTRFTMSEKFYVERLLNKHSIQTVIPERDEMEFIHRVIYQELMFGIFKADSKDKFLEIMDHLQQKGAQGIILGCTELSLMIKPGDCKIETFDSTLIHSQCAVDFALR